VKGPARLLVVLVLPLVIGKLLELFLSSGPGRSVAEKAGIGELTTGEGIDLAKKYASAAGAAVATAATALTSSVPQPLYPLTSAKTASYAAVAQDTAELLIATGALVKVVGDFLKDRERLRLKKLSAAFR
jgi:hypothetical protein